MIFLLIAMGQYLSSKYLGHEKLELAYESRRDHDHGLQSRVFR